MKKNVFWLGLALCAGFVMTSCDDDDDLGNGGVKDLADDQPAAMVDAAGFYMVNEGHGALCAGFVMTSCDDDDDLGNGGVKDLADDQPAAMVDAAGFYMVNEGHGQEDGSVNYFKKSVDGYTATYRAYRAANDGEKLGTTTQFGTIWGDNMYLMTKQGNRLVVADAKTLKKKAAFQELGGDARMFLGVTDKKGYVGTQAGIRVFDITQLQLDAKTLKKKAAFQELGGDARMFLGVTDKKGYVGTQAGIRVFDITQLQLGSAIADIPAEEIGNMCLSAGKVFAVSQSGLYILDAQTDKLIEKKAVTGLSTAICGQDGTVWVAAADHFLKIDPENLEMEQVAYPEGGSVFDSWWAWNAGSLCASTQKNVLYWASGSSSWAVSDVWKYDVEAKKFSKIYTMHETDLGGVPNIYSAGLRVDPLTDELIVMGVYNYAQCWAYKLDSNGQELDCYPLLGGQGVSILPDGYNRWFPALPVFEDANQPQILLNQVKVKAGETEEVDLDEKVVDYDNIFASMMFELTPAEENLAKVALDGDDLKVTGLQPGVTACKLAVISNGVRVEKNIQIVVE